VKMGESCRSAGEKRLRKLISGQRGGENRNAPIWYKKSFAERVGGSEKRWVVPNYS